MCDIRLKNNESCHGVITLIITWQNTDPYTLFMSRNFTQAILVMVADVKARILWEVSVVRYFWFSLVPVLRGDLICLSPVLALGSLRVPDVSFASPTAWCRLKINQQTLFLPHQSKYRAKQLRHLRIKKKQRQWFMSKKRKETHQNRRPEDTVHRSEFPLSPFWLWKMLIDCFLFIFLLFFLIEYRLLVKIPTPYD